MTIDGISALTQTGEFEKLEFKETTGTHREAEMTVCAILNQRGGRAVWIDIVRCFDWTASEFEEKGEN